MTVSETKKLPPTEHTSIEVGESGVLYIRIVQPENGPMYSGDRMQHITKNVKETFAEAFPDVTIIVGFHDLRFSTITKKQEFTARLDGQIQES